MEKTNAVVIRGQEQGMGASRRDSYMMEVDRGRNYYTCRGFGHMAQHCRNREQRGRMAEGRRLEYGERREGNFEQFKRGGESRVSRLDSYNKFNVLANEIKVGALELKRSKEKIEVEKVEGRSLREVMVKIGLERINMQEGITVEALLYSGTTGLVMSSEFARKQGFKLKKLERLMHVRNVDGLLNKERPIKHTVEVNIYYQGHRERTKINAIRGQKWTVILGMPWLVWHNPEID